MAFKNKLRHKTIKQSEQQIGNMGTVHIRIRHDNNLVVTKLGYVKIIAVAFRKATAEGVDHGLDLGVGKDLIDARFLHVEDFSSDR